MRRLIASTFVSLDGVMQAPGGPTEDPSGGFKFGGWLYGFGAPDMDISAAGFDGKDRELVLGRRTYEIFEAYWPYQAKDNPIARTLNAAKKHVATRTLESLEWNNSEILGSDLVSAVSRLKQRPGHDLQIIGSGNLIQTLQGARLIDEYNLWIYPVLLGRGKRLFESRAVPQALQLVHSKLSTSGVLMNTYSRGGEIKLGNVGEVESEPNPKELVRRLRIACEE